MTIGPDWGKKKSVALRGRGMTLKKVFESSPTKKKKKEEQKQKKKKRALRRLARGGKIL